MAEIIDYIENKCKECGEIFTTAQYIGETRQEAEKGYCLNCIMGLKVIENKGPDA